MIREQPNMGALLSLLESSDLNELDQIKSLINKNLSTERGSVLLNSLVDYYLETNSCEAMEIMSCVREPLCKQLLDKINECMVKQACRLPTLSLLGYIVRKQPPWIYEIAESSIFNSLLKCLKGDSDVVVLITGVLVLITLLPTVLQPSKQHLYEFFDIFGRLAAWKLKNTDTGQVTEMHLVHLHASVYSLFHRLYGMYPCNFISYLRSHYSMKENKHIFTEVVQPMLEHVRIHPELVTGTKDHELDPNRWKSFESHDIVIQCAKVSLDPKEASCEESYSTMPEKLSPLQQQLRSLDSTASPYTNLQSNCGSSSSTSFTSPRQPLPFPQLQATQSPYCSTQTCQQKICEAHDFCSIWSPSSVCGMTTPPSSRGISPTNLPELSQSASHLPDQAPSTVDEFGHVSQVPNTLSLSCKDGRPADHARPVLVRQEPIREAVQGDAEPSNNRDGANESIKPMALTQLSNITKEHGRGSVKEREEDAVTEEDKRDLSALRGFDLPFLNTTETLTGSQGKLPATSTPGLAAESPLDKCEGPPLAWTPDQPLSFQTAFTPIGRVPPSPWVPDEEAAGLAKCPAFSPSPCRDTTLAYESLFDLALPKAAYLFVGKKTREAAQRALGEGEHAEKEGDGAAATSPLEVLDLLIQQGSDTHDKVQKRSPLPGRSADWAHFGGSAPLDELFLLQSRLQYERYKREQHAIRNRRLLRRIINATALEEQNSAMKDQLKLQDFEIRALQVSLQEEQLRYRQLSAEGEATVRRLQSQIRRLQQGRDKYYTKNQELQRNLQECLKKMGELEAELQKAKNKVCNTGHQLSQLSIKLTNSETVQHQMAFHNKQLLLLGEVNKLCVEELQHFGPNTNKEMKMLQVSTGKEVEKLRQSLRQQSQRLEAVHQRIGELETQLSKKEHLITEQKLFLEDVKSQAKGQLQASESRYLAQRQVSQLLQTELLELYSRLETESPAANSVPEGVATEPRNLADSSDGHAVSTGQVKPGSQSGIDRSSPEHLTDNGCAYSPGDAQASGLESINGSPGPRPSSSPPVAVGSYPSAKSFLGMRARELYRNKSESQSEADLAGLSSSASPHLPGTVPAHSEARPDAQQRHSDRGDSWQRQQELRIMDYNEAHQEQT